MSTIAISNFGGMRPSVYDANLAQNLAQRAVNTRLLDGRLMAIPCAKEIKESDEPIRSLYLAGVSRKECSEIACSPLCTGTYLDNVTGCGGFDSLVVFSHASDTNHKRIDLCTGLEHPLCIEGPTAPLQGQVTTEIEGDPDARIYTYTWVDTFGVETTPAPPSEMIVTHDESTVTLIGFQAPPAGAVCIRIYRTPSVFEDGRNPNQTVATKYQRVREIPLDGFTGTFEDFYQMYQMDGEVLSTLEKCCPGCFEGTVQLDNGQYVGWQDNRFWISETMRADNFPVDNMHELEHRIINMVAFHNVLFVATTGHPYRFEVQRGENNMTETVQTMFNEPWPIINRETMVETPFGAMYASRDGLVAISQRAAPVLISKERLFPENWPEFHPHSAAYYQGRYYGFRPGGNGFVFDVARDGDSGLELGDFYLHTEHADFARRGPDGLLYLVSGNSVKRWGEGELKEYCWHSRDYIGTSRAYGAIRINAQFGPPVKVKVFADYCVVAEFEVEDCQPCRMPRLPRGCRWSIQIKGTTPVQSVILGYSTQEINNDR